MAKQKTGDKLGDIRTAAIAEVVGSGSTAVSVNAIADRAGLAVGTLYRYYENKDQLLRSAYLVIKREIHGAMMEDAAKATGSKEKIKAMWFATLNYAQSHPEAFLFAELIVNDAVLTAKDREEIAPLIKDIRKVIETAIEDGTVLDSPPAAIMTVLSAPAIKLGQTAALSKEVPDHAYAEDVFKLCWRAVAA